MKDALIERPLVMINKRISDGTKSHIDVLQLKTRHIVLVLVILSLPAFVMAQDTDKKQEKDPFGTVKEALDLRQSMSVREMKAFVKKRVNNPEPHSAADLFLTAELMKQIGDYRAQKYYEKAIQKNDAEPAYELFYADYLRNFRGPQRPLFPDSERHYFEAWRKLAQMQKKEPSDEKAKQQIKYHTEVLKERIERGLVTLYQEDGLPLFSRSAQSDGSKESVEKPAAFLSSINRSARSTSDLDEVHDVRDLTSEALFSSSSSRLNRALTSDELRAIIRLKEPAATFERLRFRHGDWPVVDFFYQRRVIEDAQITNFFQPNKFNDVKLHDFGIAVEKPFNVAPYFDIYLRGAYRRIERKGVLEFLPLRKEGINQFEGKAAVARFFGPDKANLEFTYAFQDINPDIPSPPTRNRRIVGVTAEYQVLRHLPFLKNPYGQLFATRGLHLFGGFAEDKERFGNVDVKRHDHFLGASVNGLGPFDITLQPTVLNSKVSGDKSQTNSQFRTEVTVLLRVLDEERQPGIPHKRILGLYPAFVNFVFPFKKDVAIDGLKAFENYKVAVALNMKFFRRGFQDSTPTEITERFRGTTFLVSLRYDHQRFHRLDKNLNLFGISVSMGF